MLESKRSLLYIDGNFVEIDIPIYRIAAYKNRAALARNYGTAAWLASYILVAFFIDRYLILTGAIKLALVILGIALMYVGFKFFHETIPNNTKKHMEISDYRYYQSNKAWPPK